MKKIITNLKIWINYIKKLKNTAKKQYLQNFLENNKKDMKKSWNIINEMMKRSKKSNNTTDFDLTSNGHLLKNPENALNEHYANIAAELSKKFTKSSEWKRTLTNPVQNSVFFG